MKERACLRGQPRTACWSRPTSRDSQRTAPRSRLWRSRATGWIGSRSSCAPNARTIAPVWGRSSSTCCHSKARSFHRSCSQRFRPDRSRPPSPHGIAGTTWTTWVRTLLRSVIARPSWVLVRSSAATGYDTCSKRASSVSGGARRLTACSRIRRPGPVLAANMSGNRSLPCAMRDPCLGERPSR